jgi:hypothetical protein
MNQLSWLLYWADVLPHFAIAVGIVCTLLAIFSALMTVLFFTAGFGSWTHDKEYTARFRYFPVVFVLAVLLAFTSNLIPSKNTFYLIAASEAGEQALKTPEVSKVRAVINKWLEDAAAPSKKDDDDK